MVIVRALMLLAAIISCNAQSPQCPEFQNKIDACVSETGIPEADIMYLFYRQGGASISFVTAKRIQVICSNQNDMQQAYRCIYKTLTDCSPSALTGNYPNVDSLVVSVSYICKNKDDIDFGCVARNNNDASLCIGKAMPSPPTSNADIARDMASHTCSVQSATIGCYKKVFSTCPTNTAEVLTNYLSYTAPAVCDAPLVRCSLVLLIISLCCGWLRNMV